LLEDAAAHHRHGAAAALGAGGIGPRPGRAREAAGGEVAMPGAEQLVLQLLEGGADSVAQGFEPGARLLLVVGGVGGHELGNPVCRIASPATMAAAMATLSDLKPGRIGIRTARSAASRTSGGTPALSWPTSSESAGRKAASA